MFIIEQYINFLQYKNIFKGIYDKFIKFLLKNLKFILFQFLEYTTPLK